MCCVPLPTLLTLQVSSNCDHCLPDCEATVYSVLPTAANFRKTSQSTRHPALFPPQALRLLQPEHESLLQPGHPEVTPQPADRPRGCTALHCTALHCTALHCTALHCTALHCTALHCTAPAQGRPAAGLGPRRQAGLQRQPARGPQVRPVSDSNVSHLYI
jgi:hypothetical protein